MNFDSLTIIKFPSPILKQKCEPIVEGDGFPLAALLEKMEKTCRQYRAFGLAANQLGINKQVFVILQNTECKAYINPEITSRSEDMMTMIEGCLSFPDKKARTRRARSITVSYLDKNLNPVLEEFYGLSAVIFQHEYDHLQGKTMRDREYNKR